MKIMYQCRDLHLLRSGTRVRNANDAARVFAQRIARKMFGGAGHYLRIKKILQNGSMHLYEADIGTKRMKQSIRIPVVVIRS